MNPVGRLVGVLLAPVTGAVSLVRRARMFHPEGVVYRADVTPLSDEGARLAGDAMARFSGAWWRGGKEWTDVLGLALRIGPEPTQDLLFATIRSPWTTLLASLSTKQHDFLANDFYAVSPFDMEGVGRVKLRVRSPRAGRPGGKDRSDRLARAVAAGAAILTLEIRELGPGKRWRPVAQVALTGPMQVDQEALRFSPFRDGRGIRPRGFVHALRKATYAASQAVRPRHASMT